MNLKLRIQEDMKNAMRAKEAQRLNTIRLLLAAIKEREIQERQSGERIDLEDTHVLAVIEKMIKQRRDSIEQYQNAGRQELADVEKAEIDVLETYLPPALSETEIQQFITQTISSLGASGIKDMGKVIAQLKPQLQGRADMGIVSAKVKQFLQQA